jgi:hypothetical protein
VSYLVTWEGIVEAGAEKRHRCCPSCGAAVEAHWLFCPHCEEPLLDPSRPLGSAEREVRCETSTLGMVLLLLTLPGGIGIFLALLGSFALLVQSEPLPMLVTLAGLLELVLLSGLIVLLRGPRPGESTAERIALCTLSLAGVLVTGAFLLGLAESVYRFLLCSG